MNLRRGVEIDLTGDTREAPEVLILEIGAVAPAHHLHGDEVAAWLQILGDVELGSHLGVLGVAHILAVNPEREVARGRAYVEEHLLPFPVGRQFEGAAIRASVVVRLADIRGIGLEGRAEGIACIDVGLVAIAIDLEKARHGEILPLGVVVLEREEVLRSILMVAHEAELPHALHREITGGGTLVAPGLVDALEGEEMRMARFTVLLVDEGVFPYWLLVCCRHREGSQTEN